jgi:hypothetical protein
MNHKTFEGQLENLRSEANLATRYVYAELAINYHAAKSKRLLQKLNETPHFWMLCRAGFQTSAYLAISRVFERKNNSRFNLENLLLSFERELPSFQREALESRKLKNQSERPEWLNEYLDTAYYPSSDDAVYLRRLVEKQRLMFDNSIRAVRNQYFAHRQVTESSQVSALFGKGTIKEICQLCVFLVQLHDSMRELLQNGRKPAIRARKYSIDAILSLIRQSKSSGAALSTHERIVWEVRKLLMSIELVPFGLDLQKEVTQLRRKRTARGGPIAQRLG